jgi:two-component system, NarL family, response regulator LiaR
MEPTTKTIRPAEAKNPTPIQVLVVDDHAVVRSGLAAFLLTSADMELAGEAADGIEAVRLCRELEPDVVLMDIMMPEMDGIAATRAIHEYCPRVQVVALTSFPEEQTVKEVLQAGAISYLLKNASSYELMEAIRYAHKGRPTLSPEATRALIHAATHPHAPGDDLTTREREVLELLVRGLNNRQIAQELVVSHSTAKCHVSNVLSKLGVTGRTEAVAQALQHHLVASS